MLGCEFLLFVKAFLAVTPHISIYRHFFVLLSPAILGFSFHVLRNKASFTKSLFLDKKLNRIDWLIPTYLAGSRRVLTTAMDDWSENLFVLAPVQAYAYVR